MKVKMKELNKKTISTLIISILMLSMAVAAMPMASAVSNLTIHLGPELAVEGSASADWNQDPLATPGKGQVAKLVGTTTASDVAYVRVYPIASGVTISNLLTTGKMPTFKYYTTAMPTNGINYLQLEFRFTSDAGGWAEITVNPYNSPGNYLPTTIGAWTAANADTLITGTVNAEGFGRLDDDSEKTMSAKSLTALLADWTGYGAGAWKLTRVSVQLGYVSVPGGMTAYIDDVKVGTVTYNLEPGVKVGDKLVVSGTSKTLGGLVKIYWDSVRDWDSTSGAGYLAETYAVGYSYSVEVTIPVAIAGNHPVIVKDIEAAETAIKTITVNPKIVLSPTSGIPLDTITVTGTGYGNADTIIISASTHPLDDLAQIPTLITTSALGSFTATFVIPAASASGDITASGILPAKSATATLSIGRVITLTPSTGLPGTTVTVAGRGFTGDSTVDITAGEGVYLLVNDYPTDSSGAFTTTITIPAVTAYDYEVTAKDAVSALTAHAHFTVTGVTAITLTPKSGLSGTSVAVTGDWFTKGKTVTIYLDGVSVGTTTAGTVAPFSLVSKTITIPVAATFGAHTIKAMDSEGVYATATFTVSERVTVIETRSTTYMPGDTLSFNIHSTVAFRIVGGEHIVVKIYDPDGYLFWNVDWVPVLDATTDTYVVPYSAQTVIVNGVHLTLPSDAMAGLWKWNATYYLTDVVAKTVKQGSFTVKATTASAIDEKITALEQSINLLGVQILAAQTAAQAAQTAAEAAKVAATAAGTKTDAALTAAIAAQTAATTAGTKADAALTAAQAATTAAQGAKTSADSATTAANAAKAATDGLTTLVYAAIGASLVAALAAVVALMQISKKIA